MLRTTCSSIAYVDGWNWYGVHTYIPVRTAPGPGREGSAGRTKRKASWQPETMVGNTRQRLNVSQASEPPVQQGFTNGGILGFGLFRGSHESLIRPAACSARVFSTNGMSPDKPQLIVSETCRGQFPNYALATWIWVCGREPGRASTAESCPSSAGRPLPLSQILGSVQNSVPYGGRMEGFCGRRTGHISGNSKL